MTENVNNEKSYTWIKYILNTIILRKKTKRAKLLTSADRRLNALIQPMPFITSILCTAWLDIEHIDLAS